MRTPHGLAEIIATFGDARKIPAVAFEAANIVRVVLPESLPYEDVHITRVTRVTCHRLIASILSDTLHAVHAAGLWPELAKGTYGGGYAHRQKRGVEKLSTHAWGIAWDFSADIYPLDSRARMPDDLIRIFTSRGFVYGGDFGGRPDPQHFQFASGY